MNPIKLSASLPQPAFGAKQVQQNEARVAASQGIEMYPLMERAGAAVFSHLKARSEMSSILVICGKGNNGGDGYVIARLAKLAGIDVITLVLAERKDIGGDAALALQRLLDEGGDVRFSCQKALNLNLIRQFSGEWILDCIFGIGFKGQLSADFQAIVQAINEHSARVISVDVPSGLSAETGVVDGVAVIADTTITFIAVKRGLLTGQAANHVGELYLAELGLGCAFIDQIATDTFIQGQANLPGLAPRTKASHKGSVGMLLAIGGNKGMPGAVRMASEAALRSGASLMSVSCHSDNQAMVLSGRPELMLAPGEAAELKESTFFAKAKAIVIGPGLGQDDWARQLFQLVIEQEKPCLLDADALALLSQTSHYKENWVLTPHPGEAALLLDCTVGDIEADRYAAVKKIAQTYGGICLLKGAGSLISDGRETWVNTSGNPGMASGGMGDVLSGIIAGLILQMSCLMAAVRYGAFIHGHAADIIAERNGERGILASDLFVEIQKLVNRV